MRAREAETGEGDTEGGREGGRAHPAGLDPWSLLGPGVGRYGVVWPWLGDEDRCAARDAEPPTAEDDDGRGRLGVAFESRLKLWAHGGECTGQLGASKPSHASASCRERATGDPNDWRRAARRGRDASPRRDAHAQVVDREAVGLPVVPVHGGSRCRRGEQEGRAKRERGRREATRRARPTSCEETSYCKAGTAFAALLLATLQARTASDAT